MPMSQLKAYPAIAKISEAAEYAGGIVKASETVIKATTEAITSNSTDLVSASETISSQSEEIKKAALELMEKVCYQTCDALKQSPYEEIFDPIPTLSTLIEDQTKFLTALSKIYTFSIHASTAHAVAQSFISNSITASIPEDLVITFTDLIDVADAASKTFAASAAAVTAIYSIASTTAVLYPTDEAWISSGTAKGENDDDDGDYGDYGADDCGGDDYGADDESFDGDGDDMDGDDMDG